MKAILLAGGQGTRLRPLTLDTPKPVVPIFNRPFLQYQLDLVRQVPEIEEVIVSLNYQPERIEQTMQMLGNLGVRLKYLVEPKPLGTAGAIKFAERHLDGPVVVLNGDVLSQVDLAAVLRLHRDRQARATIVLVAVDNPSAYGLVETDSEGRIVAFREKPEPGEISCDTINAGLYVLEPDTLDRIPENTNWSIERSYFPSLVEQGEMFLAYVSRGYWIDIGTPAKYLQVHRDIMEGRYVAPPFAGQTPDAVLVAPGASIAGATLKGPCFIDEECLVEPGARIGPFTVLGRGCRVEANADVDGAIVWPGATIGSGAVVHGAIVGKSVTIGRYASVHGGTILGERSVVTDYSRI